MQLSGIPTKVSVTWGVSAPSSNIRNVPNASQIGVQAGAASFTDGFPPVCFLPLGAGGTPPFGQDFNGIIRQISQWMQWQGAGGTVPYDSTFQTAVGGYPAGAVVQSALSPHQYWYSSTDSNTNNPDSGSYWGSAPYSTSGPPTGWNSFGPTTGDMKHRPTSETQPGWVRANANTLGSASSGATEFAGAQALALYAWHWTNFSNTQCPVTGGRGASAAADFNANKPIQLLDLRGRSIHGVDTMGGAASTSLNGVPIVSGSSTAPGSVFGENLHQLIASELASHSHTITDTGHIHTATTTAQIVSSGGAAQASGGNNLIPGSVTVNNHTTGIGINNNSPADGSHNNVALSMGVTWYIHL